MMTTSFNFEAAIGLQKRRPLKQFLKEMNRKEGDAISRVSFIFCSDAYLLSINNRFLKHDYFTDIITFGLNNHQTGLLEGEIYISVARVTENAKIFGVSIENELHRVMFHGILHLLGYKDKTQEQKHLMRKKEDLYLKKYKALISST